MIARTGGDELCLLLPAAMGHDEIANRIRKIVERIEDPYFIEGAEIFASATAGVSFWPRDDESSEGLRQKAKAALAEARRATASARACSSRRSKRPNSPGPSSK